MITPAHTNGSSVPMYVKTRAALEEFDKQLKDDLVSHHYSRYRRVAPELHKVRLLHPFNHRCRVALTARSLSSTSKRK
jgi:hypothetical protein